MTTQTEIRNAFWQYLAEVRPELAAMKRARKSQNDYNCDIRTLFVDYVDGLCRDRQISDSLARRVTL